jgi:phenylalanyl-tRNA synthetase beta subunit
MLISYKWLKEYIEGELPSPEKVSEVLNTRSFEVESIEKKENDFILDVKITPNRAHDCACHVGVAKEIAINCDLKFKDLNPSIKEKYFDTNFEAEVTDKRCLRYMLREIRNVEVGESHSDLKNKMESLGEKSINNVVDITNIVLFELGQPMHAFDRDKLSGEKISARTSQIGESMTTLDNNFVEFDDDTCVIADTEPLAVAGIKGGKKAEVDFKTKNLILESANFSAGDIRKISNKIGIETESSKRYENRITPTLTEIAINRATELLLKYGGPNVEVSNVVDIYPRKPKHKYTVGLKFENVEKVLGVSIDRETVEIILNKLEIPFEKLKTKEKVVGFIKTLEGKPYKHGASISFDAPDEFDCSSLTSYVYSKFGVQIPRISVDQYFYSKPISKEELEAGDLIFSNTGVDDHNIFHFESKEFIPGTKFEAGIDHVGIYLGEGKIIHATNSKNKAVTIEDLESSDRFQNTTAYSRPIEKDEERYVLEIPDLRLDLRKEIDIIEEIGRIYGYENIESKPIEGLTPVKNSNQEAFAILKIKSVLQELGFSEVYTSSFDNKGDVKIMKALAKDKNYLRTSLINGINNSLTMGHYNADLIAIDRVQIFEIGKVFSSGVETLVLGLGVKNKNSKKPKVNEILTDTLVKLGEKLGVKFEFAVKDGQEFAQIDLTNLIDQIKIDEDINIDFDSTRKFQALSQYPFMSRDISVWIPTGNGDEKTIFEIVEKYAGELLKTKSLFDIFEKDGRTSYAIRVVFQSNEKTLTDEEVSVIMNKIYEDLKSKEGFEIR